MKNKFFLSIILILGSLYLIYKVFNGFQLLSKSEKFSETRNLEMADSAILSNYLLKNGKVVFVRKSKIQNSFLNLFIDNKYNVFAYKINTDSFGGELSSTFIQNEKKNIDRTVGVTYHVIETKNFKLSFKAGSQSAIDQIILTHSNGMDNWQRSDSTFVLNGFTDNFSIRYGQNQEVDLYFEKKLLPNVPISLIFRVKKGKLIFYLITSEGGEYDISDQLIKNVIG